MTSTLDEHCIDVRVEDYSRDGHDTIAPFEVTFQMCQVQLEVCPGPSSSSKKTLNSLHFPSHLATAELAVVCSSSIRIQTGILLPR